MSPKFVSALLLIALPLLSACESIAYYGQAVSGQLSVLQARQPLDKLLQSDQTPDDLRQQLLLVEEIRHFAEHQLGLPVGKSYSSFAALDRPAQDNFVVWNVFAAEELSLDHRIWCYPVAGCAQYRGYFSRAAADGYARKLQAQGMDTYVAGVKAYSTLGWFADPVLSTFIHYPESRLAALLFHEMAHKLIYLKGDTEFNESFATTLELAALQRWLAWRKRPHKLAEHERYLAVRKTYLQQAESLREELRAVYQDAGLSEQQKRLAKADVFTRFQQSTQPVEDEGLRRALLRLGNNAALVPVRSYNRWLDGFQALLQACQGDFEAFFAQVRMLAELQPLPRETQLQKLTDSQGGTVPECSNARY